MIKSKKYFMVLPLVLLFLTGCTVDYNLKINDDLSVDETINCMESDSILDSSKFFSRIETIGYMMEPYLEKIDTSGYTYDIINNKDVGGVLVKKKYNSLEDYTQTTKARDYSYPNIDYKMDNNIVTIESSGPLYSYNTNERLDAPNIAYSKVTIETKFKVISNNADNVGKNKYTWLIVYGNNDNKQISLSFDKTKLNDTIYIGNIIGIKYTYLPIILFIVIVVPVLLILSLIYIRRNAVNNKI